MSLNPLTDQQREHYSRIYTDPEHFTQLANSPALQEAKKVSPFGDNLAKAAANRSFIAAHAGIPSTELGEAYEPLRDGYAKSYFGKDSVTEEELFSLVSEKFQTEAQRKTALQGLQNTILTTAFESGMTGESRDLMEVFQGWRGENDGLFTWEQEADLLGMYHNSAKAFAEEMQTIVPKAAEAWKVLSRMTGREEGEVSREDYDQLLNTLVESSEEERQSAYGLLAAYAETQGLDKAKWAKGLGDTFRSLAESAAKVGEGLSRSVTETYGSVSRSSRDRHLSRDINLLESGKEIQEAGGKILDVEFIRSGNISFTQDAKPVDEARRAELLAEKKKQMATIGIERELSMLAQGVVDPIKAHGAFGDSWLAGKVEQGIYDGAQSAFYTALAAPGGPFGVFLAGTAIWAHNYDQMRYEYPDASPDYLATLAAISAGPEAMLERMQFNALTGKLPMFGKVLERMGKRGAPLAYRLGAGFGLQVVEQNVQELAQDGFREVVTQIGAALNEDMPGKKWDEILPEFASERVDTFFALLPMVLIGTGSMTYRELKRGAAFTKSQEMLRMGGFSSEVAAEIANIEDPKARDAAIQEEWNNRKPEDIEAGKKMAAEQIGLSQEAVNGAFGATIEEEQMADGGVSFVIKRPDGTEIYRTQDSEAAIVAYSQAVEGSINSRKLAVSEMVEFFSGLNAAQERGENVQQFIVENTPKTLQDSLDAGEATIEQLQERMRIAGLEGGQLSQIRILGENIGELREGVYQDTIKIYEGANPLTVIEERAEGEIKRQLAEGRTSMEFLREQLAEYDRLTGESLLGESDQSVIEGVSSLAQAYMGGRLQDARIPSGLRAFLRQMVEFFKEVFQRAGRLRRLFAEGKLDQNFEQLLAESVGLDFQQQVSQQVEGQVDSAYQELLGMSTFSIQGAWMPKENRAAQQSETGQPSQSGQIAEVVNLGGSAYLSNGFISESNGRPKLFFHGKSGEAFEVFEEAFRGSNTAADSAKEAFFATDNPDVAAFYTATDEMAETLGFEGFTGAVDVIRDLEDQQWEIANTNGLDESDWESDSQIQDLQRKIEAEKEWIDSGLKAFKERGFVKELLLKANNPVVLDWNGKSTSQRPLGDAIRKAKREGNDAVIFENVVDPMFPSTVVAFFTPDQVLDPESPASSQGAETTFSISPAMAKLDADYLAAVERGDMEAAQEMVDDAAEKAGYDIKAWHYSERKFKSFDRSFARTSSDIHAFFFKDTRDPYKEYGKHEYRVYIKLTNPANYKQAVDGFNPAETDDAGIRQREKLQSQGFDGAIVSREEGGMDYAEIIAFDPNQIKSADPVTRDEQGNVIPLSQRFNPERPEITYSISPYEAFEMDPVIQFLMENRVLSKTAARKQLGAERFNAIAAIWDDVPVMAHPSHNAIYGDRGLYPDEAATMLSNMELLPSGATAPDLWAHVQKVSDSARRIAEQSRAQTRIATPSRMEQMDAALARLDSDPAFRRERVAMARRRLDDIQRRHGSLIAAIEVGTKEAEVPRVELIRTIAELEAITRILPPEARGNIGGYKRLAELKTDRGRVNFMVSQIGKVGTALEGWLSEQYREQIDSLLEKTGAKVDQSKIRKGRFTPEVQRVIERIKDIVKLDEAGSEKTMEDIFQKLDDATDPQVIQQLTSDLQLLEMFADMESKSAAVLEGSHRFLSSLINLGRDSRKMLDEQFRTEMAALRGEAIKEFSGGAGILGPNEALYMKQKRGNQKLRQSAYKFHLKNQSMEWLLNAATRPSKDVGTLQGKITKWASRVIHRATHQERRERTRRERAGHAELARIFGTKPGLDTARALYEYKSTIRAVTGIYVKLGRKVEVVPVDAVIAERSDAQMYALGFTAAEVEQLRKLAAENNKRTGRRKRTKLQLERVVNPGVSTELAMTMDQAVYWFMLSRQEGPKSNMERYGWDESSFSALKEFLSPQAREIATWLSKEYADGYGSINEVYRQIHFVDMPQVMNYSPVRYETDNRVEDNLMDGRQMMSSTSPGFIKQRQRHSAEPLAQGALDLYFRHMVDSEHYKAWALPMRELRAVLGSKDVQKTIEQQQGRELNALIQDKLDQFAAGGRKGAFTLPTLDFIRSSFVVAKQAYNWGVALKQLTSFPAYMFDVPVLDFMQYQAEFWVNPGKNFKDMLDIPFVKQRFGEGYDRDMMKVMREFEGMEKPGTRLARAAEWGMIFTRAGDIMPVIVGGYSAYRYRQEQALAEGMSEAQAKAEAELFFEMTTERAQQAGDVKDLSWYQSGGSVARMLTMFMTSPRQYYSNVYESFLDMKAGKKGAGAEFARRFAIGQLVLPVVFQLAGDIVRNAFREPDDRELNPWDYIRAMAIGPFNGLFVMGSVLDTASHWATKGWWFESAQLTGLSEVSRINMGIGRISKMIQAGEIDPETLLKALDDFALAGSSMAGGHWVWYDIGRRLIRSVGLDDEAGELTGEFLDWVESGGNE